MVKLYNFPTLSSTHHPTAKAQSRHWQITFNRSELSALLRIYGFKVAAGEWRDYSIDHLKEKAVFSVYRRSGETALYRIEKHTTLARTQGMYKIIAVDGYIMRRGHELRQVLKVLEKHPFKVFQSKRA